MLCCQHSTATVARCLSALLCDCLLAVLPVCLQVCNHRFHGECIKHWGDTSCPVCRYCMLSSNANTSRCSTCGANTNLWICLICGHVGCGR